MIQVRVQETQVNRKVKVKGGIPLQSIGGVLNHLCQSMRAYSRNNRATFRPDLI